MTFNQRVALRRIVAANDSDDDGPPMRGIVIGCAIGLAMWAAGAWLVWGVFAR